VTSVSSGRRCLVDFSDPSARDGWEIVDDGVMGGSSQGRVEIARGRMSFWGELVTEGGGFTSVRSAGRSWDLSDVDALVLAVHGDGRRYQVLLDTGVRLEGGRVTYRADFDTEAGTRQEIRLALAELVPMRRGRRLAGPLLDRREVGALGVLIADGLDGSFRLEIERIEAERLRG